MLDLSPPGPARCPNRRCVTHREIRPRTSLPHTRPAHTSTQSLYTMLPRVAAACRCRVSGLIATVPHREARGRALPATMDPRGLAAAAAMPLIPPTRDRTGTARSCSHALPTRAVSSGGRREAARAANQRGRHAAARAVPDSDARTDIHGPRSCLRLALVLDIERP